MPVRGCQTKILVNEFDFSGDTNSVTVEANTDAIEYSVFQNCAILKLPGRVTPAIQHNGYYSAPDAGELEAEMHDALDATDTYVCVILGTSLAVPVAYVLSATFNQQLRIDAPLDNLITVQGNWPGGTERIYRGVQVANGVAVDATGALDGVDNGAGGSAGGVVFLFVTGIGGSATDATVLIESDSDSGFGTAATEATLEFSAVGVYTATMSGTVGRYLRANVSDLGGADDVTFVAVACVSGQNY